MKARELSPDDPRLIINKKQIYQTKYRKLCEAGEEQWLIYSIQSYYYSIANYKSSC